tara:strand:+ start:346 stop:456 length:111 start_codon:yes stop_codon:yes gene_type:complete
VIGDQEVESNQIDVRQRDGDRLGKMDLNEFEQIMVS